MESFIFSINAISGGGKTTITKEIQKKLPNWKALFFDDRNYDSDSGIHDTAQWIDDGLDVNLFDLKGLADDIIDLKNDGIEYIIIDGTLKIEEIVKKYMKE